MFHLPYNVYTVLSNLCQEKEFSSHFYIKSIVPFFFNSKYCMVWLWLNRWPNLVTIVNCWCWWWCWIMVCSINVWIDLHNGNVLLENYIVSFSSWANWHNTIYTLACSPRTNLFMCHLRYVAVLYMFSQSSQ